MARIRNNVLIAAGITALTLAIGAGSVSAQAVGTPGEPQCHGERVSTGNHTIVPGDVTGVGDLRLTPKGRAEALNLLAVDGRTDWTVQDFQDRVRAACEAP